MAMDLNNLGIRPPKASTVILFICILLYTAFRIKWIGHLLVWDEAISLCTIRSFLSHGTDDFSNWFWCSAPRRVVDTGTV